MKRSSFFLILIIPLLSIAQNQGNVWYFGDHAGLDFNSGVPIPLTNGQTYTPNGTPIEGTAVISDSSGVLLFYTNGQKIWNKNQQVMPHGDSLLGHLSSTQAALIIPQPGSSRYFYVFTTDAFYEDNLQYGFRYSIVDICRDNGLGDIMPDYKNIKLLDTVAEKLTAVRHTDGIDYWVITHKYYSDAFYAYHLSSMGIIDTVISHSGSIHPTDMIGDGGAIGQLKASPNGEKLAIVNGNAGAHTIAEYFDFDKSTGIVSNCVSIQTNLAIQYQYQYYGVSFSPDNSKLYITSNLNNYGVFQFNLNAGGGNEDSVRASITKIAGQTWCWGLQLGADGKIYVAGSGWNQYISVINNPNGIGLNCNFQDSAIYLNGRLCSYGLPNFIDSYDYSNTSYDCGNGIEEQNINNGIIIYPNPSSGTFQIENSKYQISNVEIYNAQGKLIFEATVNRKEETINLNLPDGLYFVQILCPEGNIVKKIIIQN